MKCAVHPEVDATGYCRNCGKALCTTCAREVRGMMYCESCLADMVTQPRQAAVPQGGSPAAATLLGFIPGLGAVYNGQYMKAIVHVLIFVSFIGVLAGDHPDSIKAVCGVLLAAFIIYMAIDANLVTKERLRGNAPADAFIDMRQGKAIWPFVLIGIGFLFLLRNFNVLDLDKLVDVWWPLGLIIVGAMLAWRKMGGQQQ